MKVEKTYNSHAVKHIHTHGVLSTKPANLRLVKREALPVSVEHIIEEDVEHFRNVEDFLCDDDESDMIALLLH